MEYIKKFKFKKNDRDIELEVFWGYRHDLFINKIKIENKEFDLRINKCQLMKNDTYGDILRIDTNIKNKEVENFVKELTGKEFEENSLYLIIPNDLRISLDDYIEKCYKLENGKSIEDEEKKIFELAKKTGEKQKLKDWVEPCNNPYEECNLDYVCIYAMPDGTRRIERQHSY